MSSSNHTQKRYPGVKPFKRSERNLFYGRDQDVENLIDLIGLEKLVVLFSKSGYGKSSIINAGILPKIETYALPIVVRIGNFTNGENLNLLGKIQSLVKERFEGNSEASFLDNLTLPDTLWKLCKINQTLHQRRFVFIFDQFEEFFTYPIEDQVEFKEQVSELLYTQVPQNLRNKINSFSVAQQDLIATPFDARILLSIRADRLSLLDSMKDKLPAILQKRYELHGLSKKQASEAILGPAQQEGNFASPQYKYSSEALEVIIQKLGLSKSSQSTGIEAFQLQILCEYLEDKVIKGEVPDLRIEQWHFSNQIDEIFEGYYYRLLKKLRPVDRSTAQLLIEDKLIFEDKKTGEARRLSVDTGIIYMERGITKQLLDQLEDNFLLRREPNSVNGFSYEVSHDTLIPAILKSKSEREIYEQQKRDRLEAQKLLKVVEVVRNALAQKNFRFAFEQLESIEGYKNQDIVEIITLRKQLFDDIEKEKEEAKKQKERADMLGELNRNHALSAYANDLAYKSVIALQSKDRTIAFQLAVLAHRYVEPGNPNVKRAFFEALYYNDNPNHFPISLTRQYIGHTSYIQMVVFSPDGKYLATGSNDNTAKVWEIESGNVKVTFKGHTSSVTCISFSPDGKYLATGSDDKTAKIWSSNSGEIIKTLKEYTSPLLKIAFSSDGKQLISYTEDSVLKIWDLNSEKPTAIFKRRIDKVTSISMSKDGKKLITTSLFDNTIKIWDVFSNKVVNTLQGHTSSILNIAISPDGEKLASASSDSNVIIWNLNSGEILMTLKEHTSAVICVTFTPDSMRIATASIDNSAKIWDLNAQKAISTFAIHASSDLSVSFSSDGKYLATASYDNTIKIWSIYSEKASTALNEHTDLVLSVAFALDDKHLATASADKTAKIWDIASGKSLMTIRGHSDYVVSTAFSPDSKYLATASADHTSKIWEIASGKLVITLKGHSGRVNWVTFSPNGELIATASVDNTAKIWKWRSGKCIQTLSEHTALVRSIVFSPDGKLLASASLDNTAKIWDLKSGKAIKTLRENFNRILIVCFSPDGKHLATGSFDSVIKIWDLESGKVAMTLKGRTSPVLSIAFSPDSKWLANTSDDNTVKIWDLNTGKAVINLDGHNSSVIFVSFSPNGQRLVTASEDYTTKIWDFTPDGWYDTPQGHPRNQIAPISQHQLASYNLETLMDLHLDNEQKLISTGDVWQIKAFADLAAMQAEGSNILSSVEAPFARSNRLYFASLALQDELLIRMDYAKMLQKWAALYRNDGQEGKAKELEEKADGLWKEKQ